MSNQSPWSKKELAEFISEVREEINNTILSTVNGIRNARERGNIVTTVLCKPNVKIGDIIDVVKLKENSPEEEEFEECEENVQQARILDIQPYIFKDSETGEFIEVMEALVECLQEGQLFSQAEFNEIYGEGTDEQDTVEITENIELCECGANKTDCQNSQSVFGVHINE